MTDKHEERTHQQYALWPAALIPMVLGLLLDATRLATPGVEKGTGLLAAVLWFAGLLMLFGLRATGWVIVVGDNHA